MNEKTKFWILLLLFGLSIALLVYLNRGTQQFFIAR